MARLRLPTTATRLLVVAADDGVPLVDVVRDGAATSDDTHLTSGLLQAFHQFAREVDQGEVAVIHFGQAAHPAVSPRSPPGTATAGWVYSRTAGRVYSGSASGSLRAQMARAVAAGEAPAKVQTLVAHRESGLLFGMVSTNPKIPAPAAVAELRAALATVAGQFVHDYLAALEPLRPRMRTYRNDDDDKRTSVAAAVTEVLAPFVSSLSFATDSPPSIAVPAPPS